MKYAIALAGNIVVDTTKYIPAYPGKLELTPILGMARSMGGAVPNVGIGLAKLDGSLPLAALGFVVTDQVSSGRSGKLSYTSLKSRKYGKSHESEKKIDDTRDHSASVTHGIYREIQHQRHQRYRHGTDGYGYGSNHAEDRCRKSGHNKHKYAVSLCFSP